MKGAREQLLDIKNKTQHQSSRWSSVIHVHTVRYPKLHWLAEARSLCKVPFRLSIRTVDVTVKHYFPPSPPLRLLSFLLSSARPSAKSVKGSRGLI